MDREELKGYILEKMAGSYDLYNLNASDVDATGRYKAKKQYDASPNILGKEHKKIEAADAYMNNYYGKQSVPKLTRSQMLAEDRKQLANNNSDIANKAKDKLKYQEMGTRTHRVESGRVKDMAKRNVNLDLPKQSPSANTTQQATKSVAKKKPKLSGPLVDNDTKLTFGDFLNKLNTNDWDSLSNESKVKGVDKNSKLGQVYGKKYRYPEVGRSNNLEEGAKNVIKDKATQSTVKDSTKNIAKNNPLGVVGANNRTNNSLDKVRGTKVTPFVNTPQATGSKIGPLKENVPKKSVNGKILSTGSGLNKNPKLVRSYKSYRLPEVGRSNNLEEGAKKVVNDKATQSTVKDSIKNGASAVKDTVKSGANSAATAVKNGGSKLLSGAKKGGKLALIGTGIGLGVAGGKALLGGNKQSQDDQRLATFTVVEDGIEKQAIAFSGIEKRDIPKTKRKDKKRTKKFYKSLPTEKKREFLNKSYKEKAKLYNKTDSSKDSLGNFVLATVPSAAGTVAALKGHPKAGMALNAAMIPGFAGQIASNMKNNRADAYAKKKTMDDMLGIKDKKANTFNNDMEKQAIAFSGKKIKDIPRTSARDRKEVREYYKSLSPEDKHKFDVGADIGSLKYYDAYDRKRDNIGNTITTATLIGAPLGWPGVVAAGMKENRAVSRGEYDQMQKMKKHHKKEASELLDSLYKEASVQGVSGLANATNAVSPFAKATLKDASSTPLPSLETNSDATNITPPPKPPKTDATEVKNDISSSTSKEANEVINSFAEVLEKTASEFLGLSEEELQPKDSEYMANKRLYIDLFNSPNINW